MDLTSAIAAHLAQWDDPVVERAIYGTDQPADIATMIERFVADTLGVSIAACVFHRSSVGAVTGLVLRDGRRVVVKAQEPRVRRERLVAVQYVMHALAQRGFPCPAPLHPPAALARGLATIEALVDRGEVRDGHEPAIRRELARRLAELVHCVEPSSALDPLGPSWFSALPAERLWPRPHSPLFDFEATRRGAESIDAIAAEARRVDRAGTRVIGHFDWRAEHARFSGDRMVVAYDWDSLHVDLEPVVVGAAAHAFCAEWERESAPAAPSADELRAFVAEYEAARGSAFGAVERRTLAGSLVYSLAYTARCTHALGAEASERALAFRTLLEREAKTWLGTL